MQASAGQHEGCNHGQAMLALQPFCWKPQAGFRPGHVLYQVTVFAISNIWIWKHVCVIWQAPTFSIISPAWKISWFEDPFKLPALRPASWQKINGYYCLMRHALQRWRGSDVALCGCRLYFKWRHFRRNSIPRSMKKTARICYAQRFSKVRVLPATGHYNPAISNAMQVVQTGGICTLSK